MRTAGWTRVGRVANASSGSRCVSVSSLARHKARRHRCFYVPKPELDEISKFFWLPWPDSPLTK